MQQHDGNMEHAGEQAASWGNQHAMVIERRVGLRQVELRRTALRDGESFFFAVNNVPVYAKGGHSCVYSLHRQRTGTNTE